ncbi:MULTISPECIES: YfcC family protein [Anaerostipes]|uniref:YfcC family protein n=1 Tax=Anaerostipes TaxID=207244 RepID=UPI001E303FF4|nr:MULTISPECIES: YfcC family protein [Anaerostipes]MCI5622518.1 YfcC family protein [Anaerostipes sp.]MDY2726048.1 YfcC family protein [Anaerostipes faecalis]
MKKKKIQIKALNPMVLLAIIIVLCAIATYIVPAGEYERVMDAATNREVVDPNTFHYVKQNPVGIFALFMSVTLGLQRAGYIIFFLFIIGGMFQIMEATGAIHNGMSLVVKKMAGKELLMIPVCMIIFGCGSCFAGNFEEFLAFVPLVLSVCIAMGFDSLTAIGIIFCSAASGYAGAMTNAFTVGVAQGIAGLPMFSGLGFRAGVFVVLMTVSIIFVMLYARKVKKNPKSSLVYEFDKDKKHDLKLEDDVNLTTRQKLVLLTLLGVMIAMVIGIVKFGFYIDELAALFLIAGLIAGFVGGLKPGEIADEFLKGCGNLLFAGVMIGLCNAAIIIMEDANIMDTVIHALAGLLNGLPPKLSACGMFVVQDLFNVLVPSGSGQAAITMPLMAPLADLIGITRQTAVLAFQMGDAFTNVMAPTGGELLAACAMAKIPWGKWAKWLIPLFIIWWIVAFAALTLAVQIGYGPF